MRIRPRRLRGCDSVRQMFRETHIRAENLIYPLFVCEGKDQKIAITSMPGQFRLSVDLLLKEVIDAYNLGIKCISIFPACHEITKDEQAKQSHNDDHFYQIAIKEIKNKIPEIVVMTDVAMDPYSSDGHDGVYCKKTNKILNDQSLEILGQMALTQAKSGSDIIGPSDMMDGRIGYIRDLLESEGYSDTLIMSYAAKYASAFYGPFRDALDSAPKYGDKKSYQMDPANLKEARKEARLDLEQGADILMVKPALSYLDIIQELANNFELPISAYQVSGEYAMIMAAAQKGWLDEESTMMETLVSIKRAGATSILTYFAKKAALLLRD